MKLEVIHIVDIAVTIAYSACIAIGASSYFLGYPVIKDQNASITMGAIGVLGIVAWFAFMRNIVIKEIASKTDKSGNE